jgi:signal transduction histidine kinase
LRRHQDGDLPLLRGDEKRLRQALSKLLLHSIEAMPQGGQLDVILTGPAKGEAEYVEVELSHHGARIGEEDAGGISESVHRRWTSGAPLGLTIAKRIIDEHGGEIELLGEVGEGTKVIVRLPLAGRGG